MNSLEHLARAAQWYERGFISDAEFVNKLTDLCAGDPDLQVKDADAVAALIPQATRALVMRQIEAALSPGYLRPAFHLGGRSRTPEEIQAAAMRETAREKAWAAVLKPLLS